MANDLVRQYRPDGDDREGEAADGGETWDMPPVDDAGTARHVKRGYRADVAERDAAAARRRGDDTFAAIRETDAAEHRQGPWDWGDARTWLILFAMFFGFLAVAALCYYMPQGQHASPPPFRGY